MYFYGSRVQYHDLIVKLHGCQSSLRRIKTDVKLYSLVVNDTIVPCVYIPSFLKFPSSEILSFEMVIIPKGVGSDLI